MSLTVIGTTSCLAGLAMGWCLTKRLVRWAMVDDGTTIARNAVRVKQEYRAADADDIATGRRTPMQVSRDNLFVPPHWNPDWDEIPL